MTDIMQKINERANLAGTNRMEVLIFHLNERGDEKNQLFGINVFKVKELLTVPTLHRLPNSSPMMKGVANIRGISVPVIDLMEYCGFHGDIPANILILTEYNDSSQGFLVHDVDNIIQLAWSDIKELPHMLTSIDTSVVTGVSELDDANLLLILDVEKILADTLGPIENREGKSFDLVAEGVLAGKTVFYADDSRVARKQLATILARMGADTIVSSDGGHAWETLQQLADAAEATGTPLETTLQAIITDVEMPLMDGYMLTRNIKADSRFANIPVIMHTSLSSESNKRLGEKVGVDTYVAKLNPRQISDVLQGYILGDGSPAQSSL